MKNYIKAIRNDYIKYVNNKWLYWVVILVLPPLTSFLFYLLTAAISNPNSILSQEQKFALQVYTSILLWLGSLVQFHHMFIDKRIRDENADRKRNEQEIYDSYIRYIFNKDTQLLDIYSDVPEFKKEEFKSIMFERHWLKMRKEMSEDSDNQNN